MTCNLLLATAVAATALLPRATFAQDPPEPSLELARQLLAAGRPDDALSMLGRLPPSADGVTLRIEISLATGDVGRAVEGYEELSARWKRAAPDLLTSIATTRALQLRNEPDLEVRVAACEALMLAGRSPECVAELEKTAGDLGAAFESRLAAARVLLEHNYPGAAALTQSVIAQGIQNAPSLTADALARMPADVSTDPLIRLLSSSNADAQYIAALAIARRRVPAALAPLRATANDPEAGAARLMAYIALAALGELDGLRVLQKTLPLLKGRDRLEAARALMALEDPAAHTILDGLLNSERETLRIETAELLYSIGSPRAGPVLAAALESANPWVRASAINATARMGMPVTRTVRRALADHNPRIAAAGAHAVLLDLRARR